MRYNFIGTRHSNVVSSVGASVDADTIEEAFEKLAERDFKEFLITNVEHLDDEFSDWNIIESHDIDVA